jgi:pyruvate dehydrogenase E2 component (dihydrolipoamide acetyltransferase)
MTATFLLPDLGEGIHEAEILAIAVSVGQKVHEGDIILEIETDKAAVEIPSPYTGEIAEILIQVGDLARVGEPLIHFHTESAEPGVERSAEPATEVPTTKRDAGHRQPVPASPSTRRLARELGINLHEVKASGKGGVVTKEDVLSHKEQRHVPAPEEEEKGTVPPPASTAAATAPPPGRGVSSMPDFALWGPIERLPFRSIRRATANRMSSSWSQIPHVHCMDDVDITSLETFRQKHKAEIEAAGGRLTMTVFAMKAVATALKTYPAFNSSLDLEHQEIIIKRYFNLGIAVDSEHGLTVPVIRDVDRKSIKELAIEVEGAVKRARNGKLEREEMQGGSFTITNAGALGGNRFSAIINHPEVAIFGMGQGRMQPAAVPTVRGGYEIVPRRIMPVVLCFDHRVVDGGDAIRFLKLIIDALNDPDELLMTMI